MLNVVILSVANKPFMLNVVMLSVIMLNVVASDKPVSLAEYKSLYYKNFYSRNLQIFAISWSVSPWQAFQAQSNVSGQGQSL